MTFKEFVKKNKWDYVLSFIPMVLFYCIAPFFVNLSGWYYLIAPVVTLAMLGMMLLSHYNRWYPYFNPTDGMLREPPHDDKTHK